MREAWPRRDGYGTYIGADVLKVWRRAAIPVSLGIGTIILL